MDKSDFWLNNYKVLYENNNYVHFVPSLKMNRIEQLNAVTRFSIYAFILLILLGNNNKWLYFPIFTIIFTIILFKLQKLDKLDKLKKLEKLEKYSNNNNYNIIDVVKDNNDNEIIEYQDEEDNFNPSEHMDVPKINLNLQNKDKNKDKKCVMPTKDNPFMNFLLSDYMDNPDRPEACNAVLENEDEIDNINMDTTDKFNDNLYRNLNDLFDRKNSQRQFYTVPVTTLPNDQKSFAEWLYKIPETCKTDQTNCLKYEDLRYKRV
jgi:hypothetical protein